MSGRVSSSWMFCFAVLSASALSSPANADSLREAFTRGNDAFGRGDPKAAIAQYEQLVESGVDDPDVSYNLASAYAQSGHYGQAIRWFEHTLLLAPRDEDAEKALDRARQALGQRQAARTGEAIVATRPPIREAIFAKLSRDELSLFCLLSVWALSVSLLALSRLTAEDSRLGVGILASLSALLTVTSGLGLGVKTDFGARAKRAIVLHEDAVLREGPAEDATKRGVLAEGSRVRVLARERNFVRIETPTGLVAYAQSADVGEI